MGGILEDQVQKAIGEKTLNELGVDVMGIIKKRIKSSTFTKMLNEMIDKYIKDKVRQIVSNSDYVEEYLKNHIKNIMVTYLKSNNKIQEVIKSAMIDLISVSDLVPEIMNNSEDVSEAISQLVLQKISGKTKKKKK